MKRRKIYSLFCVVTIAFSLFLPTVLARQIGDYDLTLPRWGSDTTSELEKENASAGINNNDSTGGGKTLNTSIRSAYSGSDITPVYSLGSGSRIVMYYNGGGDNYIGSGTRLAMAPQFGNHVRIHTSGSWSPDSY
ncbi:Uncharacterised protein [Streptococcus pneumoniae]|nr:Uncharacterised protein [Streptococcus pneumoniae]